MVRSIRVTATTRLGSPDDGTPSRTGRARSATTLTQKTTLQHRRGPRPPHVIAGLVRFRGGARSAGRRQMNDMRVHIKDLAWGHVRAGATVGEALEQLERDVAGHALAAKVDGREVDLGCRLEPPDEARDPVVEIEPILPGTLEGLGVLRHSTAHLLAAAVLDLFPGTKLGIGPALLDDPRFGFFYDVIAPRPLTDADLPAIERRMRELADL